MEWSVCLAPILPLGKAGGPSRGLFGYQANFTYYLIETGDVVKEIRAKENLA